MSHSRCGEDLPEGDSDQAPHPTPTVSSEHTPNTHRVLTASESHVELTAGAGLSQGTPSPISVPPVAQRN